MQLKKMKQKGWAQVGKGLSSTRMHHWMMMMRLKVKYF